MKTGTRVRLSQHARDYNIYWGKDKRGVLVLPLTNSETCEVLWDGNKKPSRLHRLFIEEDDE